MPLDDLSRSASQEFTVGEYKKKGMKKYAAGNDLNRDQGARKKPNMFAFFTCFFEPPKKEVSKKEVEKSKHKLPLGISFFRIIC
jgi:hypothetical protein